MDRERSSTVDSVAAGRFPRALVYQAAQLYYLQDATQAQIASQLGTSRSTVSRLLTEARDTGVVEIRVRNPWDGTTADLEGEVARALGLSACYVSPASAAVTIGALLAPGVAEALADARLRPGDAVLVSSGATVHGVAGQPLPPLPGVWLCPTVGGVEEPEAHYQTNEIARALAMKVRGNPVPLYAPAMPAPALHQVLLEDPQVRRVTEMWRTARVALLGIGAPPRGRSSLPSVISATSPALRLAVGDICARPYDAHGEPIAFPGVERLVAIELADLRHIPHTVAVAAGGDKVQGILVAVGAGYVNTLVTDSDTAGALLRAVEPPSTGAR